MSIKTKITPEELDLLGFKSEGWTDKNCSADAFDTLKFTKYTLQISAELSIQFCFGYTLDEGAAETHIESTVELCMCGEYIPAVIDSIDQLRNVVKVLLELTGFLVEPYHVSGDGKKVMVVGGRNMGKNAALLASAASFFGCYGDPTTTLENLMEHTRTFEIKRTPPLHEELRILDDKEVSPIYFPKRKKFKRR